MKGVDFQKDVIHEYERLEGQHWHTGLEANSTTGLSFLSHSKGP